MMLVVRSSRSLGLVCFLTHPDALPPHLSLLLSPSSLTLAMIKILHVFQKLKSLGYVDPLREEKCSAKEFSSMAYNRHS
jgi:hypothetical protein